MNALSQRVLACLSLPVIYLSLCVPAPSRVDVWTWHNDNWRSGQNASESTLTPSNVNSTGFGQICSAGVDGQIYAQPLVLSGNLTILGHPYTSVVYVATMNDSVYLFDGTNCNQIANTSLLGSGEIAVPCGNVGAGNCKIINPSVGILGTPVIDEDTNHIYLVTYSYSSSLNTYYHKVHALCTGLVSGTTPLEEEASYHSPYVISSGSFNPAFVSQAHIQRPGLLLLPGTDSPDPEVYIGFSMMDATPNFPPGFIFRYNANDLSSAPVVYTTEPNLTTGAGGGIWMVGAGLAAGLTSSGGNTAIYVATADGDLTTNGGDTQCIDCGDSFIRLTTNLTVGGFFAPYDPVCRFVNNNLTDPDLDFGSGGVLLIPDGLVSSYPYIAVSADKEGYIWVMQRATPGQFGGDFLCPASGSNGNAETVTGTGLYHNTGAFWQRGTGGGYLYYASVGGPISQYPVQSSCTAGTPPLCNAVNTSLDPSGNVVKFGAGTTPAISANGTSSTSNGIVWALDGASVLSTTIPGKLWAFNATTMKHLYNSELCEEDEIASVTAFVVPTVANGYVYVGAQSFTNSGQGTFYVFGLISSKTCTPS